MATTWPATLPQSFTLGTYRETRPDTLLRSQPEAGPAIIRRRFSAGVTPFSGSMILTDEQKNALDTLYDTTLGGGTGEISFPAPDGSGGTWTTRFTAPPDYGEAGKVWRASISMEKLP